MSAVPDSASAQGSAPAHEVAQESYARCQQAPEFFATFYDLLLASDPVIPPLFARTEFPKQHKLLQHGLGLLLTYAKRPNPALLDRLAARHSAGGINVAPTLYPHFVESLVQAVRRHDPECTPQIEAAWREAVAPGIEFMGSRHQG